VLQVLQVGQAAQVDLLAAAADAVVTETMLPTAQLAAAAVE
jgi:hypothetical protein